MTELWRRIPRHLLIRIGYVIVGIKIAALWLAQGESSPWEHAVHLMVLMVVIMALAEVVRRWAARRGRPTAHHPIGRFLLAKAVLVALALAAGLALDQWVTNADLWVALCLGIVVAVVGPVIHPWLVKAEKTIAEKTIADHTARTAIAAS